MLRQLELRDAAAVHALRRAALADTPMAFGAAPETDVFRERAQVDDYLGGAPGRTLFGAFGSDGSLVGMVGSMRGRHAKVAHRASVWGMFVAPSARGAGLGRALLEAVADHEREQGVEYLDLAVSEVATSAHALYASAGFDEYGRHPAGIRADGAATVEILMTRRL